MMGSWNVNVVTGGMPEKLATAFCEFQIVGAQYNPIAYLGSQIVNGVNHAILAEQILTTGKDVKNIVLMIFNEKEDKFTLVNIERVVEGNEVPGGIFIDVKTKENVPAEAQDVFNAKFSEFVGSAIEPFAYLGSQVVNGVNYLFAAEVKPTVKDPVKKVSIITVNSVTKDATFQDIL